MGTIRERLLKSTLIIGSQVKGYLSDITISVQVLWRAQRGRGGERTMSPTHIFRREKHFSRFFFYIQSSPLGVRSLFSTSRRNSREFNFACRSPFDVVLLFRAKAPSLPRPLVWGILTTLWVTPMSVIPMVVITFPEMSGDGEGATLGSPRNSRLPLQLSAPSATLEIITFYIKIWTCSLINKMLHFDLRVDFLCIL